jgi:hypothetical protein
VAKRPVIKVAKPEANIALTAEIVEESEAQNPRTEQARDRTQAEIDADTLIGAQEIRRDPQRFMAARAVNPNIQA